MSFQETMINYHSALADIKGRFDPVIMKMVETLNQPWRRQAWLGPINTIKTALKSAKVLKGLSLSSIPIVGPVAAGVLGGLYGPWSYWFSIGGAVILAVGIYYIMVRSYENKMAKIGSDEFHVEVFKRKRREEFNRIWWPLVQSGVRFEGLYGFVNGMFKPGVDSSNLSTFVEKQVEDLRDAIEQQDMLIESLNQQLNFSENALSYLVDIIKKVNEILYRGVNNRLSLQDMDFVSGFSIYRLIGNKLEFIVDKGTSGRFRTLDIDEDVNFAAVIAAKDEREQAHYNTPYPGRCIVAFRMSMLNGEKWVWCFHFDDDDKRSLSLTLSNDIIETRQIRRLIHAFCLTIQQRMSSSKEVDQDGNQQAN